MSLRASLGSCLATATLVLSAAGAASAQSPSIAHAATSASTSLDGCVRYVANQAIVIRCAAPERQILSDHGSTVGEAYDAQGNPLDRHGDVVATPDGRGSSAREVFASDPRTRR
jgi:hypothetical protein